MPVFLCPACHRLSTTLSSDSPPNPPAISAFSYTSERAFFRCGNLSSPSFSPIGCGSHPVSSFVLPFLSFSSVHLLSRVQIFVTPWTVAHQASLSITNSQSLFRLISIELVMPLNHLILCHPILLPPSIFHIIKLFSNESPLGIRWPKYWSFSFNISASNEHSGLISFRMEWVDLFVVSWTTLESSPIQQFKSIHSSVLSFLYSPTLTSTHNYWKNQSFD